MEHLYLDKNLILESNAKLEDAKVALMGVPFDSTSSYRPGSRFAPLEIRKEFLELEKDGFFDIPFIDLGNVNVIHGNAKKTLDRVSQVVRDVVEKNPEVVLITLGGEHTVSYGVIKSLNKVNVLQLDAHADLRDDYMGEKFSHATIMRRVSELGVSVTQAGVRSYGEGELEYAKSIKIENHSAEDFSFKCLKDDVYITVDMDVLNPGIAPGVSNPEPDGVSFNILNGIIVDMTKVANVVGLDITEVNPLFDNHSTSVMAAKLMLDFMLRRFGCTGTK